MIYILAIFLLLYVSLPPFRTVVSGYISGVDYWLGTQWINHRNLLVAVLLTLLIAPLAIGWYANALTSMIIFMILFPFWIAGSISNGLRNLRAAAPTPGTTQAPAKTGGFIRSIIALVLIIAAANIIIGVWSPELKDATNTWTFFKKKDLAISVNKSTSKMESVMGTNAVITEDGTAGYNASNIVEAYLNRGDDLYVPNPKNVIKAGPNGEGYLWVMIKNNNRQFLNGKAVKVPLRLIDYDVAKYRPAASPAPEAGKLSEVVYDQFVSFNQWTEADKGYIRLIKLEPGWQYNIRAYGQHNPYIDGNNDRPMGPEGWDAITSSRNYLPLKNEKLGALIGKVENDNEFLIARGCDLPQVNKKSSLLVSLNFSQNWREEDSPDLNFTENKGGLKITIERCPIK